MRSLTLLIYQNTMRRRCFTLCLVTLLSLNLSHAIANNNAGSATLQTSVSFRPEPLETDASKEDSLSGIDQEASPSNHATSSSSFALLNTGNTASSSNLGPSYSNHQRNEEKPGSLGYSQGYILTSADPPLRATTYGPPSPVGMKYRMRRPNNPHYTTNIQHRFRGNVFPPKHLSDPLPYKINPDPLPYKINADPLPYKINPDPIPYKLNPGVAEAPIHKFPVQHDVSSFRKFYKKPPEVPVVRKSVVKNKTPFYPDVYSKDGYEENFSTSSNFDDDFNKPSLFQEFSGEEQDRPLKPDSDSDGFSKTFYDNFFTKPQGNNKEPQRDIYYSHAKPAPPPSRNLSKFYKKPISPYLPKHHSSLSSEYKSPGQIFSEPLEYARPNQYKTSSSSSISASASSPAISASASSSSGEWTPINAPQGAVPAKSYDIPAPDLSTERRRSHIKRGVYEDSLRHDVVVGTNKFNKAGNSEEIVSAVVMVKQ